MSLILCFQVCVAVLLPAADRSIMQNGGPLITTSCMTMPKLYTSPGRDPYIPTCPGILRISGAVHSNSGTQRTALVCCCSSKQQDNPVYNLISHRLQEVRCRGTSEPQEPRCSHSLWPSGQTAHPPHSYGTSDDCGTLRGGGGTSYP